MKMGESLPTWHQVSVLLLVVAIHAALLYGLWSVRVVPLPADAVTQFVTLITPPAPRPKQETAPPAPPAPSKPPQQARPVQREAPRPPVEAPRPTEPTHYHLAAEAPVVSPSEATEPLPPREPAAAAPASGGTGVPGAPSESAAPVSLSAELAVICPERTPPPYPPISLRLGETGKVVLRVELDETGRVSAAQVITSSGFNRLDAAALAAVKKWRCQPAQRNGQPVRSVAVQPFNFTLEGQ